MKKAYVAIAVMLILAPLFAWAADLVNYSEPLENAAEEAGAEENQSYSGIFPDYTVPGLNPYISALITGFIGVAIILAVFYGVKMAKND